MNDGPYKEMAGKIYRELRENIIRTVFNVALFFISFRVGSRLVSFGNNMMNLQAKVKELDLLQDGLR